LTTTAATGNGVTATLSFATQTLAPFYVGQTITVAGITPAGYNNASAVVTACTVNSVSYANATSAAQTVAGTITAVGNAIALNSTAGMAVGQEISFTGTNFGNLVDGTTYFIKQILDATHLTISATYGGAVFVLTLAAGYMQVATLGNNLYVYFGTPVPSSKPVTILHNFDK
jgi:cobalamin synthase